MEFLSSIEVLSFLDWMDKEGIAKKNDAAIEEFILDPKNSEELFIAIESYKNTFKRHEQSGESMFERKIDFYLRSVKAELMTEYSQRSSTTRCDVSKKQLEEMIESAHRNVMQNNPDWTRKIEDISKIDTEEMAYRLRKYLNFGDAADTNDYVFSYLKTKENTAAHAMTSFIQWLKENLADTVRISQIPSLQLDRYISNFLEDYYSHHYMSYSQYKEMEKIIKNSLHNPGNIEYFNRLIERYRDRVVRYKCVFISEDKAYYDLVEQHWLQLNEYTGDYLDVFYNPKELGTYRGYHVADVLNIQSRIEKFPCIYIWRTALSEGKAIATNGLSIEDLLQLVKEIVNTIHAGKALDEVIDSGNRYVGLVRQLIYKNKIIEEKVLYNLIRACIQLQSNPIMFSDVIEDLRNTQIRDLMRGLFSSSLSIGDKKYAVRVDDQGFNGLSASGKSLGRPDLFVTVESLPFSIIEGVNVDSGITGAIKEQSKIHEHIARFGNYDQIGLERNILLVYVKTNFFNIFYKSLLKEIMNNPRVTIKGSKITDLVDFPVSKLDLPEYAAIRLAKGKYDYCGSERSLYICVVNICSRSK